MSTRAMLRLIAFATLFILLSGDAYALMGGGGRGGGGRGGGGRGGGGMGGGRGGGANNGNRQGMPRDEDEEKPEMKWYDSLDDAGTWATQNSGPIMGVVTRNEGNAADKQALEMLANWQAMIDLSTKKLAATKIDAGSDKGKAILSQMKNASPPYIAWLDPYGNVVLGQSFPGSVNDIQAVVNNWKGTIEALDKFFKERQERGEKSLIRGRLRAAWQEFTFAAPYNGPHGEKARAGQAQVREQLLKVVASSVDEPVGSRAREVIFAGARREAAGLSIAAIIEDAITKHKNAPQKGGAVVAAADKAGNVVADAAPAKEQDRMNAAPSSSSSDDVYASAPIAAPPPEKSLAQLLQSQPAAVKQEDEFAIDTSVLAARNDDRLKKAQKLIEDGLKSYKKACADSMERGPERNTLLKDARDKFDEAMTTVEKVLGDKPEPGVSKLMERVSMLMYGCLKYQTL
ncbi:MAG TPA: hypothetical protein VEJ63_12285 [Planctomycetota bacterium]|nr:hypothetical protein [Planctomycetota bacterium]